MRLKPALPRLTKVFMLRSIMKQSTALPFALIFIAFSVGCATSLQDVEQNTGIEAPENVVRLSDQVVPQAYKLDLYVDPTLENFKGKHRSTSILKLRLEALFFMAKTSSWSRRP